VISHCTTCKRMNAFQTQERQAYQTGKDQLKAIPFPLQWRQAFTNR